MFAKDTEYPSAIISSDDGIVRICSLVRSGNAGCLKDLLHSLQDEIDALEEWRSTHPGSTADACPYELEAANEQWQMVDFLSNQDEAGRKAQVDDLKERIRNGLAFEAKTGRSYGDQNALKNSDEGQIPKWELELDKWANSNSPVEFDQEMAETILASTTGTGSIDGEGDVGMGGT